MPVFASIAASQPRTPISPPLEPTRTLPFTTIGAIVIVSPRVEVRHLRAPELLARRRVDGDGVSVEQVVEDLAVGVRGAAIHDVAARLTGGRLRVLGTELPLERLSRPA